MQTRTRVVLSLVAVAVIGILAFMGVIIDFMSPKGDRVLVVAQ